MQLPGVSITDYPDSNLIEAIRFNVKKNVPNSSLPSVHVYGYKWGSDGGWSRGASGEGASTSELLALLRQNEPTSGTVETDQCFGARPFGDEENAMRKVAGIGYDLILLSDVVFNHMAHPALLKR